MPDCYLSLGSNLGDRLGKLTAAVRLLSRRGSVKAISSVYETDPQIVTDQPPFLNLCCLLALPTDWDGGRVSGPGAFLKALQEIEGELGRDRKAGRRKGPRTIDIDLLLWGSEMIHEEQLIVPHPELRNRQFVLRPLLEIAPGLHHPEDGGLLADISAGLPGQGVYCYKETVVYSPGTDR